MITTYNSGIFRWPGFNRAKVKGRLNIFLMTWNLNALDSCFSLPDKGRAVFSKGEMVGAREGKTGDWAVFGGYINKCMKVLVVVYEDFACDFNLIMTCQHC